MSVVSYTTFNTEHRLNNQQLWYMRLKVNVLFYPFPGGINTVVIKYYFQHCWERSLQSRRDCIIIENAERKLYKSHRDLIIKQIIKYLCGLVSLRYIILFALTQIDRFAYQSTLRFVFIIKPLRGLLR